MLRNARPIALTCHLALIVGLTAWSPTSLGALAALVLFAPLPGLLRGNLRTFAWSAMLLAFYCAFLLADGWARPQGRTAAFALGAVAALEFVALNLYVRVTARARTARTAG